LKSYKSKFYGFTSRLYIYIPTPRLGYSLQGANWPGGKKAVNPLGVYQRVTECMSDLTQTLIL